MLSPVPHNKTTLQRALSLRVWDLSVSPTEDGELLGRVQVGITDPDTNQVVYGAPELPLAIVRNYWSDSAVVTHAALVHLSDEQKIGIYDIRADGTSNELTWRATYCDIGAVTAPISAFTAVPVSSPDLVAVVPQVATGILSIPVMGDGLGVHVFAKDKYGHVAPASPNITGVDLGFDAHHRTNGRWQGLAAIRDTVNPDIIWVVGGLAITQARTGPGDLSNLENWVFSVLESTGEMHTAATNITTDVPFIPYQISRGKVKSIGSPITSVMWCSARAGFEEFSSSVNPAYRLSTSDSTFGAATLGEAGVWSCEETDLTNWRRVNVSPVAVGSSAAQQLDSGWAVMPPREVGVAYIELLQRLVVVATGTDSGQDPIEGTTRRLVATSPGA